MLSYIPVNWELMKNPYNWIIVLLMVAIAGFALSLLYPTEKGTTS